ncbi:galactokinase [mine drainage metagenome]|uniref:Galactokinase n=1 Tax=mine drainage metagenome TaxID=410659 RepID=A0A1J5S691_9ZZZZ
MQKIIDSFVNNFQSKPKVFFSPGRINLIGEHIDYNDGYVMPAAIDKGIWFAVAANNTNIANFVSVDLKDSFSVSLDAVQKQDSWKNYVLGVLHVLEENNIKVGGFDCAFGGNLPVGAGLSSSAAVEGGLIMALNTIFNLGINRIELAKLAQKAEHGYPGVKCGIMDQFANLNGKKDHVILLDCVTLDYQHFPLQLNDYAIYLINTKVHHSLASGEYNKRRHDCEEGFAILKEKIGGEISSWRQISPEQVIANKEALSTRVFDRSLFVTQEIGRTQKAGELLKQNNLIEFGKLMFQTHEGLSKLYEVSCPELDFLVDQAKLFSEVIGARVMGGGFGGCTINIIEKAKADAIIATVTSAYQKQFDIIPEVYEVATSNGTYEIV